MYWALRGDYPATQPDGALLSIGKDGGAPSMLASSLISAGGVVVDATQVFVAVPGLQPGAVEACAKGGCGPQPTPIGDGPAPLFPDYAFGPLAVDDTCVYWATYAICSDGVGPSQMCSSPGIWKAAK